MIDSLVWGSLAFVSKTMAVTRGKREFSNSISSAQKWTGDLNCCCVHGML